MNLEIFDLTRPLGPETAVYPGDPLVTVKTVRSHDADGYQVSRISLGSHSGTHLDAPRHFFPHGATVDEYDVRQLVGPGTIVDVRMAGASGLIGPSLLSNRLAAAEALPGDFILLWTEGAWLTPGAARILLESGTTLVGTDEASIDAPSAGPSQDSSAPDGVGGIAGASPVHRLLLGNGVLIVEGLRNLEMLGPGRVTCAFLPLALVATDGAPVRAIAWR